MVDHGEAAYQGPVHVKDDSFRRQDPVTSAFVFGDLVSASLLVKDGEIFDVEVVIDFE